MEKVRRKEKRNRKLCKDCGDMYFVKDKPITIRVNHKDIEALEDRLFIEQTKEEFERGKSKIHKIWKQICDGEEGWK